MGNFTEGEFTDPSFEDLIKGAESRAKSAPEILWQTVYLYYLSRYLLSPYKVNFGEIPGEVLEEYHSGLDRLMRFSFHHADMSEDDQNQNISKMEGNMQRALLGICKAYTSKAEHWADKFEEDYGGTTVLGLVSDGGFARKWEGMRQSIYVASRQAKEKDIPSAGDEIMKLYLFAAYKSHQLVEHGENNKRKITQAMRQRDAIVSEGKNLSVATQTKISRSSAIYGAILGGVVTLILTGIFNLF